MPLWSLDEQFKLIEVASMAARLPSSRGVRHTESNFELTMGLKCSLVEFDFQFVVR